MDSGAVGREASWAGAGMLAPGGEVEGRSGWAELFLEAGRLYPGYVAEIESESGVSIDFRISGALEAAFDEGECLELRDRARLQESLGIRSEVLDVHNSRELVPGLAEGVVGGVFFPDDGIVNPRDVTAGLKAACGKHGVLIREGERVAALRASPAGVEAVTGRESLSAKVAVLAAGAWSGSVEVTVNGVRRPLPRTVPVRGHLLGYALEPCRLGPILRYHHTYLLQRAGGLLVAGSSTEKAGFDRGIDPAIADDIARRAEHLLPSLRNASSPEAWIGFRPGLECSEEPLMRREPDSNLWLAYGHYRNGILLAPATAKIVADQIMSS